MLAPLAGAGCAARRFTLPPGPGGPAPAAPAALAAATEACRAVRTLTVSMRPSGRIGDARVPSALNLQMAVDTTGRIYLEGRALGSSRFVVAGTADRATVWVREGNRALDRPAPAAEIVNALVGLPMGAERLLAILAGCVARDLTLQDAASYPEGIISVDTADATIALQDTAGGWRVRWGAFGAFNVDYGRPAGIWPAEATIYTDEGRTPAVSLTVAIDERRVNETLPDAVFAYTPPPDAIPMTLDDLRAAGPLRERGGS